MKKQTSFEKTLEILREFESIDSLIRIYIEAKYGIIDLEGNVPVEYSAAIDTLMEMEENL